MIHFDITKLTSELANLEAQTSNPDFWSDSSKSSKVLQEIKIIKNKKDKYEKIESELNNLIDMNELLLVENDEDMADDLVSSTASIEKEIDSLEVMDILYKN